MSCKENHYPQIEMDLIYDRIGIYGKAGCKHRIKYTEKEGHSICGIGDTIGQAIINLIHSFKHIYGSTSFPFEKIQEGGNYFFTITYPLSAKKLMCTTDLSAEEVDKWVKERWECISSILKSSIAGDSDKFNDIYFECYCKGLTAEEIHKRKSEEEEE